MCDFRDTNEQGVQRPGNVREFRVFPRPFRHGGGGQVQGDKALMGDS